MQHITDYLAYYEKLKANTINYMQTEIRLPQWLDELIFEQMQGKYCPTCGDMTVINWSKMDVLNYLGTYFPRSYAESQYIFKKISHYLRCVFRSKEEMRIFDFGCGTGGEIIAFLEIINTICPKLQKIEVAAFDGNLHALRYLEKIIEELQKRVQYSIKVRTIPVEIDDFYDLSLVEGTISGKYDIMFTFKAVCEFVTKERFEQDNAYEHIAKFFMNNLSTNGVAIIEDVTSYNDVASEWLPKMMDKGLKGINCNIIHQNEGYNQSLMISHSRKKRDVSKVAWRVFTKK